VWEPPRDLVAVCPEVVHEPLNLTRALPAAPRQRDNVLGRSLDGHNREPGRPTHLRGYLGHDRNGRPARSGTLAIRHEGCDGGGLQDIRVEPSELPAHELKPANASGASERGFTRKVSLLSSPRATTCDRASWLAGAAIRHFYEAEKPTAIYCHGTAALVDLKLSNGSYLVDGKTVAGFANAEEEFSDKFVGQQVMPWRVEDVLKERGANYVQGGLFKAFAVRDGRLITGQQQYSGRKVAQMVIEALGV
jgi:hypothetical protein